jgi:hypothetical protein
MTLRDVGSGEDGEEEVRYAASPEEFLSVTASKE